MNDYPRFFDVESVENGKHTVVLRNSITNEVYERFGTYTSFEEAEKEAIKLENAREAQ